MSFLGHRCNFPVDFLLLALQLLRLSLDLALCVFQLALLLSQCLCLSEFNTFRVYLRSLASHILILFYD